MKKNIIITWISRWIWKYLVWELKNENNIIWISRWNSDILWISEFNFDLTNFSLFDIFCKKLERDNIKIDSIIFNAWLWHFWKYEEGSEDKYREIINLNLLSPILFLKKLEPFLNDKAKIIFIWSIISKKFMKYSAVYQASKFWLRGFAWALKNEMKGKWIFIINPKIVETTFHDNTEINIDFNLDRITSLESIWNTIKSILDNSEKRFEIDL